MFATHVSDMEFISKIDKELLQLENNFPTKKPNNLI
jgi:hypothetical protein